MWKIFSVFLLCFVLGCASLDPRNNERIENQNGKIDEIRNNQNGVMAEIGKLKQSAEIQNSQLKEVQNGLLNFNAAVSKNENSGIQILQGDGSLMLVFSIAAMILYWYRDRAVKSEKANEIMSKEIARFNHPQLNDNVLKAAMYTSCEKKVFNLLNKHFQQS